MELEERFWGKVDWTLSEDRCWPWTAYAKKSARGGVYGMFWLGPRRSGSWLRAHRLAYELEVGDIPEGFVVDHVRDRGCTTTLCCNPEHLEAVTDRVNILRGEAPSAINARKTHCPIHEVELEVLSRGRRSCRICHNEYQRDYYRKNGRADRRERM